MTAVCSQMCCLVSGLSPAYQGGGGHLLQVVVDGVVGGSEDGELAGLDLVRQVVLLNTTTHTVNNATDANTDTAGGRQVVFVQSGVV